jgi:hypothetical protein
MLEWSWVAAQLAASQEGLSSMKIVAQVEGKCHMYPNLNFICPKEEPLMQQFDNIKCNV